MSSCDRMLVMTPYGIREATEEDRAEYERFMETQRKWERETAEIERQVAERKKAKKRWWQL